MAAAKKATRTFPMPIGEFLEAFRMNGFLIEPETYFKVIAAVSHFFPLGLCVQIDEQGVGAVPPGDLLLLKRILSPIIVRTQAEQNRFSELMDTLVPSLVECGVTGV